MSKSNEAPRRVGHEVAIALLWRDGKLLIALRPKGALEGGVWEFPGGKVESGESAQDALRRECREELGVDIVSLRFAFASEVERPLPQGALSLRFFHARIEQDQEPTPLAADDLAWVRIEELSKLAFCSADRELLDALSTGRIQAPS